MAVKDNSAGGIRFELKNDINTIKSKIDEKFSSQMDEFKEDLKENYGSAFVNDRMFESGRVFKNKNQMLKGQKYGNQKWVKKLGDMLEDAWEQRYEQIQEDHEAYTTSVYDVPTPHQVYKMKNLGKPAYHNDRKIKYTTEWSKWTGMLYEEVSAAFREGGNEFMGVANLLITSGYEFDIGEFGRYYDKVFTPWFRNIGVIQGADDIVSVSNSQWKNIANQMVKYAKLGIADPLVRVLNELEVKI